MTASPMPHRSSNRTVGGLSSISALLGTFLAATQAGAGGDPLTQCDCTFKVTRFEQGHNPLCAAGGVLIEAADSGGPTKAVVCDGRAAAPLLVGPPRRQRGGGRSGGVRPHLLSTEVEDQLASLGLVAQITPARPPGPATLDPDDDILLVPVHADTNGDGKVDAGDQLIYEIPIPLRKGDAGKEGPPGPPGRLITPFVSVDVYRHSFLDVIPASAAGGGEALTIPRPGDPTTVRLRQTALIESDSGPFGIAVGVHPFRLGRETHRRYLDEAERTSEWAPWYMGSYSTASVASAAGAIGTTVATDGAGLGAPAIWNRNYFEGLFDSLEFSFGSLMNQPGSAATPGGSSRYTVGASLDLFENLFDMPGAGTNRVTDCMQAEFNKSFAAGLSIGKIDTVAKQCRQSSEAQFFMGVGGALLLQDTPAEIELHGYQGWLAAEVQPSALAHLIHFTLNAGATAFTPAAIGGGEDNSRTTVGARVGASAWGVAYSSLECTWNYKFERDHHYGRCGAALDVALPMGLTFSPGVRWTFNEEKSPGAGGSYIDGAEGTAMFVNVGWSFIAPERFPAQWLAQSAERRHLESECTRGVANACLAVARAYAEGLLGLVDRTSAVRYCEQGRQALAEQLKKAGTADVEGQTRDLCASLLAK